jgi:hypothetical protein
MWSPPDLGMGGGGMNQLMLQADGGKLERWKGAGRLWGRPFGEKGAPFCFEGRAPLVKRALLLLAW